MRAFCIADVHAKIGFLEALKNFLAAKKPDLILFTGDIVNLGHEVEYLAKFDGIIKESNIPIFWVPGNNDIGPVYELMRKRKYSVEGKMIELGNEKIIGMGGVPDLYGHNIFPPEVSKDEMENSIFLSHIPPKKITNLKKFDWQPEKFSELKLTAAPKIQISGHIHSNWGVAWIGRTKVLKLPAGFDMMAASLDTKTLAVEFIDMKKYDRVKL